MTSALDLANTAAGFVSNQNEIESQLYAIKQISAQLPASALLSPRDEATLFGIYLQIEKYLTTRDPIRTFNKEELRSKASRGLRARLEAYESQATPINKQVAHA